MIDNTQLKGSSTELHCLLDFTGLGYQCLLPFGDGCKYDVGVDINGKIYRIQCKHARWSTDTIVPESAFEIATTRQTTNTKETIRYKYTKEDIDYFYTWFNGQGYIVSIDEIGNKNCFRWRYSYPETGQHKNIHIADDYRIEKMINSLI